MGISKKTYSDNQNATDVNSKVTEWLAKQFDTKEWNITDLLKTQNATIIY